MSNTYASIQRITYITQFLQKMMWHIFCVMMRMNNKPGTNLESIIETAYVTEKPTSKAINNLTNLKILV